jgi:uncharacterized membrane protein YhfC
MLLIMHVLNPTLMIVLPLVFGAWVVRRWGLDWAVFGFGSLTFIASQVLHIPFNQFVLNPQLERLGWISGKGWAWVMGALLLGLSAGLFEEIARYIALKRIVDRVGEWRQGVLFGLGHGGIEAILLGALVFYGLFQALALRGVQLEGVVAPERLEAARLQLEGYWGMAWYEPLWATLERLSALTFHTMAALLVLMAVRRNQVVWLVTAILAHTIFNAIALIALTTLGVAATEMILAGLGVLCLWVIIRLQSSLTSAPETKVRGDGSVMAHPAKGIAGDIEAERLDDSKYT